MTTACMYHGEHVTLTVPKTEEDSCLLTPAVHKHTEENQE